MGPWSKILLLSSTFMFNVSHLIFFHNNGKCMLSCIVSWSCKQVSGRVNILQRDKLLAIHVLNYARINIWFEGEYEFWFLPEKHFKRQHFTYYKYHSIKVVVVHTDFHRLSFTHSIHTSTGGILISNLIIPFPQSRTLMEYLRTHNYDFILE